MTDGLSTSIRNYWKGLSCILDAMMVTVAGNPTWPGDWGVSETTFCKAVVRQQRAAEHRVHCQIS